MAKSVGRNLVVKKGGTKLAAIRTKTVAWNGEAIDVTTDDDLGFRTLLGNAIGQEQIDLSGDGVMLDSILRDIALDPAIGKQLTDITIEFPDGEIISGNFNLVSFEETGPYNEAMTFTYSLQSSGAWVYTPVP